MVVTLLLTNKKGKKLLQGSKPKPQLPVSPKESTTTRPTTGTAGVLNKGLISIPSILALQLSEDILVATLLTVQKWPLIYTFKPE